MRRLLFITALIFAVCSGTKAQYLKYEPLYSSPPSSSNTLEDGWYKATVQYHNTGTAYKASYTLRVKVSYNTVTAIDFGDGYLHSGVNSSGYYWSGGTITLSADVNGNITGATAKVTITDKDIYPKVYTIYIK